MNTTHQVGATSKIITTEAYTASTGLPYTAGAWNTATLTATYCKDGGTVQSITLATMTAGTWASGGFVHRGKGVYELGAPDAAFSTTVDGVEFAFDGISGVVFKGVRVDLVGTDPRSATIPDVNVTKVGGTTQTAGDVVAMLGTIDDYLDTELAAVLAAVDTEVAAIKAKTDNLPTDPADASDIAASFTTVNTKLDTIDDFLDTEVAAIKAKTDNLPSDPADASDIASAFATVNSTLATVAGYLDTEIAAIKAKTDNLPSDPADASDIAASFTSIAATLATMATYIDTEVAAIKAKTDNLPAAPAATGDIPSAATIATQVLTAAASAPIAANVEEVNGVEILGAGVLGDKWRPA